MLTTLHPQAPALPPLAVAAADLTRALAAVLPHAARGRELPTLAAVRFETDGRALLLIATDRYTLAAASVALLDQDNPAAPDARALIAVRDARRLARLLADNPTGDIVLTLHPDQVTLTCRGGQLTAPPVEGPYPPWRTLLRARLADTQPPAAGHGYDPVLLARFTTAVGKGEPVTLRYGAADQPALVLADRFAGMVMPFRHHQPPDTDWLTPTSEATAPAAA